MYSRAILPEDLVFEILSWLPALSLIRFKCVRKSWRDLVEDPKFAAKQLSNQNSSPSCRDCCLLLVRRFGKNYNDLESRFSLVSFADDNKDTSTVVKCMDFQFYTGNCWLRVSGYCHGIVCLTERKGDHVVALANPGIRQFRVLPDSCISFPSTEVKSNFTCYSGFGYDPVSGDYKVVRLWILDNGRNHKVEVYTLSTNSWREINWEPIIGLLNRIHGSDKYFNGAYYWWIEDAEAENDPEDDDGDEVIEEVEEYVTRGSVIVFDFSKEVFLRLHFPDPFSYSPTEGVLEKSFFIMDGSLVLVAYNSGTSKSFDIRVINRTEGDKFGIEVTKLDTIGPLNGVKDLLVFWKNNEILLESWDNVRIASYKKAARDTKLLPIVLSHNFRLPYDVKAEVYASSLISIARGD